MDEEQDNHKILKMLADNERAVSEIYRIYADRYPKHRELWTEMAKEEIQHARLIEELSKRDDLHISKTKERFTPKVFNISFQYLEEKTIQAQQETLSFKETLSIALDIETGMLERGYFNIFEGDSPEFQRTLGALDRSTQKHCNKIRTLLARQNRSFF